MKIIIFCKVIIIIIMFNLVTFVIFDINYNTELQNQISKPYNYPIVPETEEWVNLDTAYEKIKACQIPEDILHRMTTEALVKTVLDYPLLMDILASNDMRDGFLFMFDQFNGFQELSRRPDALIYLEKEYDILEKTTFSKERKGEKEIKELLYQFLLQQPEFGAKTLTITYETAEYSSVMKFTGNGLRYNVKEYKNIIDKSK